MRFDFVDGLPVLAPLLTEETDGKRHYILPNGDKAPSVTTVLGHFKKNSLAKWRAKVGEEEANKIANRASTRGTKIHNIVERFYRGEDERNILKDALPSIRQGFYDLKPQLERANDIHYIEASLFSMKMKLAGRCDLIANFDCKLSVVDFKTSTKSKREDWIQDYFQQATAYALMYEELTGTVINQIVIMIAVDGEPEPQVFIKQKKAYVNALLDKVATYHKAVDGAKIL